MNPLDTDLELAPLQTLDVDELRAEVKRITTAISKYKGIGVTGSTPPLGRLRQRRWNAESRIKTIEAE